MLCYLHFEARTKWPNSAVYIIEYVCECVCVYKTCDIGSSSHCCVPFIIISDVCYILTYYIFIPERALVFALTHTQTHTFFVPIPLVSWIHHSICSSIHRVRHRHYHLLHRHSFVVLLDRYRRTLDQLTSTRSFQSRAMSRAFGCAVCIDSVHTIAVLHCHSPTFDPLCI